MTAFSPSKASYPAPELNEDRSYPLKLLHGAIQHEADLRHPPHGHRLGHMLAHIPAAADSIVRLQACTNVVWEVILELGILCMFSDMRLSGYLSDLLNSVPCAISS